MGLTKHILKEVPLHRILKDENIILWKNVQLDYYNKGGERIYEQDMINFMEESNRLTEGLISSVDIDKSVELLNKRFPSQLNHIESYNDESITIYIESDDIEIETVLEVFKFLNTLGWYLIGISDNDDGYDSTSYNMPKDIKNKPIQSKDELLKVLNKSYDGEYQFVFEKKYVEQVKDLPKYLYHVSRIRNRESILSKGLLPKSKQKIFSHDKRVYLILPEDDSTDYTDYPRFINHLLSFYDNGIGDVYRIDTSKLNNSIKFFKDTYAEIGIFTESVIPVNSLELIDTIKYNRSKKELISIQHESR